MENSQFLDGRSRFAHRKLCNWAHSDLATNPRSGSQIKFQMSGQFHQRAQTHLMIRLSFSAPSRTGSLLPAFLCS